MADGTENGTGPGSDRGVTGRTPSDAAVDLFRDAVVVLGKLAPYIVIAALAVFGAFKFVAMEDAKMDAVRDARQEATAENRDEILALKTQILEDTSKMTQLQSTNVDSITKQIEVQRLIGEMATSQTGKIAELAKKNEELVGEIASSQRELNKKRGDAAILDAQMVEMQRKTELLEDNADLLERTDRVASDILAVLSSEARFVPTDSLWQIAERYEGGTYDHVGRDYAGNVYYGAFRLRGGIEMAGFIDYVEPRDPFIADALRSAGGAEAASAGAEPFPDQWRRLAQRQDFAALQRDFITDIDYRGMLVGCRLQGRLDLDKRPVAVRAAFWAATVQHGQKDVLQYCTQSQAEFESAPPDDRDLIEHLYAWRREWLDTRFAEQDPLIKRLLRLRYELEEKDAYQILSAEN